MNPNFLRAATVEHVLSNYSSDIDLATNLTDLLTDVMHWCALNGVGFETQLRLARMHLEHEGSDAPVQPFDDYEIHPCQRFEEPGSPGRFYFEQCEPHEADVWTLYGHINGRGLDAIGDFAPREHAEEILARITGSPASR